MLAINKISDMVKLVLLDHQLISKRIACFYAGVRNDHTIRQRSDLPNCLAKFFLMEYNYAAPAIQLILIILKWSIDHEIHLSCSLSGITTHSLPCDLLTTSNFSVMRTYSSARGVLFDRSF